MSDETKPKDTILELATHTSKLAKHMDRLYDRILALENIEANRTHLKRIAILEVTADIHEEKFKKLRQALIGMGWTPPEEK